MTDAPDQARIPSRQRRARVLARGGAFLTDAFLVAYALWAANFLLVHLAGEETRSGWLGRAAGFLGARPWLLLLAPLVAVLWEVSGQSLGQLGYRVRIARAGAGADLATRAFRGLVAGALAALALVPAALAVVSWQRGGAGSFHLLLTVAMGALIASVGFFDPWGRGLADLAAGTVTDERRPATTVSVRPWWQRFTPWIVIGLLALTFAVGGILTEVGPGRLFTGAERTRNLWAHLFHPDWSITSTVIEKLLETVFIALVASTLALPFAFGLSFLGARNVMQGSALGRVTYVLTRVFMNVTRSIEPLIWAIIFVLWVNAGPFAGMLALFVHSVAALGKLYSEAIEGIDPGPVEAIRSTGANGLQTLRYGVVPQVVPPFLSFTVYRWDINVRMATILGLVGAGGIGDILINYVQLGAWSKVGTIIVFVTIVVWAMDWLSSKARQRLV